jgi:CysZ protein
MRSRLWRSLWMILKDPLNLTLACAPVVISLTLYVFLGWFLFKSFWPGLEGWIQSLINLDYLATFLTSILIILGLVVFTLVMGWSFSLVASLLAAPFNILLSQRIRRKVLNQLDPQKSGGAFKHVLETLKATWLLELKKIFFIGFLSTGAIVLGFVPLFAPVSFVFLVFLFCFQYLDYAWSEDNVSWSRGTFYIFRSPKSVCIAGVVFFFLFSLPVVNLIIIPWATSYFTLFWCEKKIELIKEQVPQTKII